MTSLTHFAAAILVSAVAVAQTAPPTPASHLSQFVTGLDIEGRINSSFSNYHNNTLNVTAPSMSTTACNPGTVLGVWEAAPDEDHPFICQMYVRLHNNRLEQVNDWSYVKHSFGSTNSNGCGGGCTGAPFDRLGLNCSDTYGATLNNSRTYLGPPREINGWTGEWRMFGSHLDVGYPAGAPDGNTSTVNPTTNVQFRVNIPDSKVGTPGASYFAMVYYLHKWEPTANRENNMSSRQINLTTSGASNAQARVFGSVVETRYTGARVESGSNVVNGVTYDGKFYVGSHVSPNGNGTYHYEYVVHNRDNHGGNAEFRIPLCAGATYSNAGFKDVDLDASNDWSISRIGDELVFSAPVGNAQPWNTLFNFWFDSDAAPVDGNVTIFEGSLNPGAAGSICIPQDVPALPTNLDIGGACGATTLTANSKANIPAPAFGLQGSGLGSGAPAALHMNITGNSVTLPVPVISSIPGCELLTPDITFPGGANGSGDANFAFSIPNDPSLEGFDLYFQVAAALPGGPIFGFAELSNRLRVRIGNCVSGCP